MKSVIAQSVRPQIWVIVDDGSTDETAEIIKLYAERHEWIRYVYREKTLGQMYFGSNVQAILKGLELLAGESYEYIAILDADISLPKDYYNNILNCFERDERLGIASGVYVDNIDGRFRKVLNDRRSTPKGLMVFRKSCYESIGGFIPLKYGYEDTCACIAARMKGWKTWSFPDMVAIHNKPVGTGHSKSLLQIRFRLGIGEYFSGSHPLFVVFKSMKRCFRELPFLSGGLARLAGYVYGYFMHEKRQVPEELVQYLRKEQISRILRFNRI
jgi:GT2 family glycosyltransferase